MRTQYPLVLAIALAMAIMMLSMSGMGAYFAGSPEGSGLTERFNESAKTAEEDIDSSSRSVGGLFGYVTSGAGAILTVIGMVVRLPIALQNIGPGLPAWAATPLGLAIQILLFFGIWQWLGGRIYR